MSFFNVVQSQQVHKSTQNTDHLGLHGFLGYFKIILLQRVK